MAKKFHSFKKQILEIKDIKETVKALEKISAANIHSLRKTVQRMRDYEAALNKIFSDFPEESISHPLFRKVQNPEELKVVLTIEKGLCGGLLSSILNFSQTKLKQNDKVLVVGERGKKLFEERGIKVDYFFPGSTDIPKKEQTREIRDFIISQFLAKNFSRVSIIYSQFKSLMIQSPVLVDFLPFEKNFLPPGFSREMGLPIYEPSKKEILDCLIKKYLGVVFYQKILEMKLSELAAKTVVMEQAGERAEKLAKNLWHQYLREKRETITKEINDLSSHCLLFK